MRIAIIENDEVINVILADEVPENGIECPDVVSANWKYIDGEFQAPKPIFYVEEVTE